MVPLSLPILLLHIHYLSLSLKHKFMWIRTVLVIADPQHPERLDTWCELNKYVPPPKKMQLHKNNNNSLAWHGMWTLKPAFQPSFVSNLLCGFGQITLPLWVLTVSLLKQES